MTVLVYILSGIAAVVALILIVALFVRKSYSVKRSVLIDRPKQEVFDHVKLIRNSEKFSKWVMLDPNSKRTFSGTDGTIGYVYGWESDMKNVGAGEQEIKAIAEGEKIDYEIRFFRPFKGVAQAYIATEPQKDGTEVTWVFDSSMKYPMNFMLLFMDFEKMLGKDMEESLQNLKVILEKGNS
ncbi:MAG TPA: SRPBCC family protein [Flavobacterium sp.]|nr:SRPBCC family protein [Flavobacterium sp.]